MPDSGDWNKIVTLIETSNRAVMQELERQRHVEEVMQEHIAKIRVDIGQLKVKASLWGALSGAVLGGIGALVALLKG